MRVSYVILMGLALCPLVCGCQKKIEGSASASTDPGCTKDADCKGDRICSSGMCGPPPVTDAPVCPPCMACPACAPSSDDAPSSSSAVADAASGGSTKDVDRARQMMLDKNYDQAKFILYNRLTTKLGTADEYRVLLEACRATGDRACADQCKKRLANQ